MDAQGHKDLCADAIVPQIRCETKFLVGFNRIESLVLKGIGFQFIGQTDSPPLLLKVKNNASALFLNHTHGPFQLFAAITAIGTEDISRQASRMNTNQDVHIRGNIPFYQGHVLIIVNVIDKRNGTEVSVGCAQGRFSPPLDKRFRPHPVGNNIRHRGDLDVVFPGKLLEVRKPGHGTIILHDAANHGGRLKPCETCQIYRPLCLPCSEKDPSPSGTQREDKSRLNQIFRNGIIGDSSHNGVRPVSGPHSRMHPFRSGDGNRKGCLIR